MGLKSKVEYQVWLLVAKNTYLLCVPVTCCTLFQGLKPVVKSGLLKTNLLNKGTCFFFNDINKSLANYSLWAKFAFIQPES